MKSTAILRSLPWWQLSIAVHLVALVALYVTPRTPVHFALHDRTYGVSLAEPGPPVCEGVCQILEPQEAATESSEGGVIPVDDNQAIQLPHIEHEHVWVRVVTTRCPQCSFVMGAHDACEVPDCLHARGWGTTHRCSRKSPAKIR